MRARLHSRMRRLLRPEKVNGVVHGRGALPTAPPRGYRGRGSVIMFEPPSEPVRGEIPIPLNMAPDYVAPAFARGEPPYRDALNRKVDELFPVPTVRNPIEFTR